MFFGHTAKTNREDEATNDDNEAEQDGREGQSKRLEVAENIRDYLNDSLAQYQIYL